MSASEKDIVRNRNAFHEYHILDKYEAGAVLQGTEVKSIMDGRIQLKESYVSVRDGEIWLFNAHVSPYSHGNRENHEPLRTRKLLLHKREIERLEKEIMQKGMTLVVTNLSQKRAHKI
jgi:SsrA-binding protein